MRRGFERAWIDPCQKVAIQMQVSVPQKKAKPSFVERKISILALLVGTDKSVPFQNISMHSTLKTSSAR
jgi:hypothetical protein